MLKNDRNLIEDDRRYVWHAMSGYDPQASTMVVTEGEEAWISDSGSGRYLDGMSGLWCVNVGYGREELARVAYEQLKLDFSQLRAKGVRYARHHSPPKEVNLRCVPYLPRWYRRWPPLRHFSPSASLGTLGCCS
jgi:hypothetical protein